MTPETRQEPEPKPQTRTTAIRCGSRLPVSFLRWSFLC